MSKNPSISGSIDITDITELDDPFGGEEDIERWQEIDGHGVDIGIFSDSIYPDGDPVAYISIILERGAANTGRGSDIPPRPHHAPPFDKNVHEYLARLKYAAQKSPTRVDRTLLDIADDHQDRVKMMIEAVDTPPNAPATIRKKGFDDPLIDHSIMFNSIDRRFMVGIIPEEDNSGREVSI